MYQYHQLDERYGLAGGGAGAIGAYGAIGEDGAVGVAYAGRVLAFTAAKMAGTTYAALTPLRINSRRSIWIGSSVFLSSLIVPPNSWDAGK